MTTDKETDQLGQKDGIDKAGVQRTPETTTEQALVACQNLLASTRKDVAAAGEGIQIVGERLQLPHTRELTITEVISKLGGAENAEALSVALRKVFDNGGSDLLSQMIKVLDIHQRKSVFEDPAKLERLTEIVTQHPMASFAESQGIATQNLGIGHVFDYWDHLLKIFDIKKFAFISTSNEASSDANRIDDGGTGGLVKASGNLYIKMLNNPDRYGSLRAESINDPKAVMSLLQHIDDPSAILEVIIGETIEDMAKCPDFLKAFCANKPGTENPLEDVQIFLALLLQRMNSKKQGVNMFY